MEKLNIYESTEEIKMLMNEDETAKHTEAESDASPKKKAKSKAKPTAKAVKKSKAKAKPTAKPEKKVKAKSKADAEGTISLASLCKELKISGATARRKLREAEVANEGRWTWKNPSRDLDKVRKLLAA